MSRAYSVVDEVPGAVGLDRAALLLDETLVFQQWEGWAPTDTAGGGVTAIGQTLYNTDGTLAGRLIKGGAGKFYLATGSGTSQKFNPFKGGAYLLDIGGGEAAQFMIDPMGGATKLGTLTPETGGSAPSYSGTQAAQAAAFAHDQAMANLQAQLQAAESARDFERSAQLQRDILAEQQKFQAEQSRLAEEAMLKRERLDVLQGLVQGFLQSQQRASEFVLQLQGDPFRFAAAAQGMPVMGTTPQEGYAGALTEFAQRPAPTMDPNAPLSAIEGGISTMMGQQMPLQPGLFGGSMASGGFLPFGPSGEISFIAGDPREPGVPNPEVVTINPTGARVSPIVGSFATGGGVDFDVSSIMAGLAPLYARLGFENVPTVHHRGPRGDIYFAPWESGFKGAGAGKDFLTSLGINPNLIRNPISGAVYYREDNTLRHIQNAQDFERMGFNWRDVINVHPSTISDYGWDIGSPLREAPGFAPRAVGPMGAMPFAAIEPTTGAPLPAPYRVAAERRRLYGANPQMYDIGTSAYNYPGSPIMPGALRTAEDIFTPRGMPRGLIGYR